MTPSTLRRSSMRHKKPERPDLGDGSWRLRGKGRDWPAHFMEEKTFQAHVESVAVNFGWRYWHCNTPNKSLPGLPDLILIKDRILWRELKVRDMNGHANTARGKQLEFMAAICLAAGDAKVWTWPDSDQEIFEELSR